MSVAIIDEALALQRANGKTDLARDLMAMLHEDLPQQRSGIEALWQAQDRAALRTLVHKVHGGTRYCGVPQLQQACDQLETAIDQGEAEIEPYYTTLLQAIDNLLELDLSKLFGTNA